MKLEQERAAQGKVLVFRVRVGPRAHPVELRRYDTILQETLALGDIVMIRHILSIFAVTAAAWALEPEIVQWQISGWKEHKPHELEGSFLVTPSMAGEGFPTRATTGIYDPVSKVGFVDRNFSRDPVGNVRWVPSTPGKVACSDSVIVVFQSYGRGIKLAAQTAKYETRAALEEEVRRAAKLPPGEYYPPKGPMKGFSFPLTAETEFFDYLLPDHVFHDISGADAPSFISARVAGDLIYWILTRRKSARSIEVSFNWRRNVAGPQRRLSPETENERRAKVLQGGMKRK